MKYYLYISICLLLTGCTSQGTIDNQKHIRVINDLQPTHKIIEILVDSTLTPLDTLSVASIKYDKEGRTKYTKTIFFQNSTKSSREEYFTDDGDHFLINMFDETETLVSSYETHRSDEDLIQYATQISNSLDGMDTTILNYTRTYHGNSKIKKISIRMDHPEVGSHYINLTHNIHGKPIEEASIFQNDTISINSWEYLDTTLVKTTYTTDSTRTIYYFNEKRSAILEDIYKQRKGQFFKYSTTNFYYDNQNRKIKATETELTTNEKKYVIYRHIE